ncbi:hypothetical protein [Acidithiobacillus ferrooxidans]|uniref:hypothetical protein n=1 Tax=Acidithiobacillus ferrooxidans TaxID=920 RepID=UPI000A684174|nr:hypothetical protein [Acidithiobacillus ferrooxidans]
MSKSEHIATPVETMQHRLASTLAAADKVSVKQLTMSTDDLKLLLDLSRGYAAGIRDAADVAFKLPNSPQWQEITERLTDQNTQALAWRTSAAILALLGNKGETA